MAQSLDANAWTHLNPLKRLRMRWESAEGRRRERERERVAGRAMTRAFCAKTRRRPSSETTLGSLPQARPPPRVFCHPRRRRFASFAPPSLFPSTLSRRSGLRGPAVKGCVVLKGTLKRMPPDANCAVRERLALSATGHQERPRDDSLRATARFIETIVTRRCSISIGRVCRCRN